MKAFFLAAMTAVAVAGSADADVFRYVNTNAPATDGDDRTFFIDNSLVIDESSYPGGRIGGSVLVLSTRHEPPDVGTVESGGETYRYVVSYEPGSLPPPTVDWSPIGITEFMSPAAVRPVAYSSDIFIRFAPDGGVLTSGGAVTEGGSNDYSFGRGDWTVERISPAPVPLPGAAGLLLAGAAALMALRMPGLARKRVPA